jgi:hypothetical protein
MSGRAWILFLSLSSLMSGVAFAVTPIGEPDDGARVAHARVAVDLESNTCQVLWQAH